MPCTTTTTTTAPATTTTTAAGGSSTFYFDLIFYCGETGSLIETGESAQILWNDNNHNKSLLFCY